VRRAHEQMQQADLILWLVDASDAPLAATETRAKAKRARDFYNECHLPPRQTPRHFLQSRATKSKATIF